MAALLAARLQTQIIKAKPEQATRSLRQLYGQFYLIICRGQLRFSKLLISFAFHRTANRLIHCWVAALQMHKYLLQLSDCFCMLPYYCTSFTVTLMRFRPAVAALITARLLASVQM